MQPVLETRRLRLRLPAWEDAAGIAAYASDPEVSRYVSWPRHRSLADADAFLKYAIGAVQTGLERNWVIIESATAAVAGTIGLRVQGHRMELGYVLARHGWGRGVATEAAEAVVAWALAQPEVQRVWAVCDVDNVASARVLEKIGMLREGRLARWAVMPNLGGDARDCWCYARVK
jgi:[ribosomal protein S5]-alanine N-acetyltransferase